MNYAFFKVAAGGRPFVTLKWAMTLDGKIARPEGGGAISGPDARRQAHVLRDQCDAILIGAGTALVDDPRLTVRPPPRDGRQPVRVVLDSRARLPSHARLLAEPGRTIVITTPAAVPADRERLEAAGAQVVVSTADEQGRVDLPAALDHLGKRGILSVLVEGGARVHGAFLGDGLADRVVLFLAPCIMGDGLAAVGHVSSLRQTLDEQGLEVRRAGADLMLTGYLRRYHPRLA